MRICRNIFVMSNMQNMIICFTMQKACEIKLKTVYFLSGVQLCFAQLLHMYDWLIEYYGSVNQKKSCHHLRLILFLSFSLFAGICLGQVAVSGCLTDRDDYPIEKASVFLINKQDSIIGNCYTDSLGQYAFFDVEPGAYTLKATSSFKKDGIKRVIIFRGKELKVDFKLLENTIILDEVDVKGVGVITDGDTIKYIISQFVSGQEQTLGDILEALPGVQIDQATGNVSVNGKNITRILVDKADLFQGNKSMPINNLPADDVKSIDVIENYSEYSILEGFKMTNETVINLNLSDAVKNRISGKLEAEYGVMDKYNFKDFSLLLRKKMMVSTILSANNTGKALLTTQDVIGINGGMSELLSSENRSDKLAKVFSDSYSMLGDNESAYRRNNGVFALNSVVQPTPKIKLLWSNIVGYDRYKMQTKTNYCYLATPLNYDIESNSNNLSRNIKSELKASFLRSNTFNVFYNAKMVCLTADNDEGNIIMDNPLRSNIRNRDFDIENSLLAIKKIGLKNTINFRIDQAYTTNQRKNVFDSEYSFYPDSYKLGNEYDYHRRISANSLGAEAFLLYRLNDSYYLRMAIRSDMKRESLSSELIQDITVKDYDTEDYFQRLDNCADLQLKRDRGALQFSANLKLSNLSFDTNISDSLSDICKTVVLPSVNVKYSLSPIHYIQLTCNKSVDFFGVKDIFRGIQILNYRNICSSSIATLFGNKYDASLIHSMMKPLDGLSWINTAMYSYSADVATNNLLLNGSIQESVRITASKSEWKSVATSLVKRQSSRPIETGLSISYSHGYSPYCFQYEWIQSHSNIARVSGRFSTYYKKGFNYGLTASYSLTEVTGGYAQQKINNIDIFAKCAYTHDRLHAEINSRFVNISTNGDAVNRLYMNFESRWDKSKTLSFFVRGNDVFHISSRNSETSVINNFFIASVRAQNIPGHVIAGIILNY